jgi:hypothetical protein
LERFIPTSRHTPILNLDSLVDLTIIGMLFVTAYFLQAEKKSDSNSQFGKLVDKEAKPGNYYGAW